MGDQEPPTEAEFYPASRDLTGLYPTPSTYDERLARDNQAERRRMQRRPKLPLISACLIAALAMTVLFDTGGTSEMVMGLFGATSGVFVLFLLGLAVAGIYIWQLRRCVRFFNDRGFGGAWFVWLYLFTGFVATWLYVTVSPGDSWTTRLLFAGGHAVAMMTVAGLALQVGRRS